MTSLLITVVLVLAAILAGIFQGNGAVYFFNKMPAQWLCDYGQQPTEELTNPYTKRIKSYPWKYLFTMFFVVINVHMATDDWRFAVAATCAIWLLLVMSIGDIKYRIVPDQLIILLAAPAIGLVPYHDHWKDCLFGAIAGFCVMAAVAGLGKLTYKRESLGGGDIKLFATLGLLLGTTGILSTIILTTLISAGHLLWLLGRKKIRKTDTVPMVPYIAIGTAVYMVFLWGYEEVFFDIFAV